MSMTAYGALVRRDLRLFFTDRRAVIMSMVAPILIGSFFGYLFGSGGGNQTASRIPVSIIDEDQSQISANLVDALGKDKSLELVSNTLDAAREGVRSGKITLAAAIPKGFADQAVRAFLRGEAKPELQVMYDPSHAPELAMIRGILMQHAMEVISSEAFGTNSNRYLDDARAELDRSSGSMDPGDRKVLRQMLDSVSQWNSRRQANPQTAGGPTGFATPYTLHEEAVTARKGVQYNGFAHSFGGMSVQFILMMGVDAGLLIILQRRGGIWKRLRAAPLSRFVIIGSRATSATIIAVMILFVVFGFARLAFHVTIDGSLAGFVGICLAFGVMTAAFGLLVAVSGKTVEATRGLAILVTLILVMLGGAWVPAFLFPPWLQQASFVFPTRWAVDALDGVTWRGMDFVASLRPIAALLGFAALFGGLAVWRFRWED